MRKALSVFLAFALALSLLVIPVMADSDVVQSNLSVSDILKTIQIGDPDCILLESVTYLVNECGQRVATTPNEDKASAYVKEKFEELGYTDVFWEKPFRTSAQVAGILTFNDGSADILGNVTTAPFEITQGANLVPIGTHLNYAIPEGVTGDIVGALLFDNAAVAGAAINTVVNSLKETNPEVNIVGILTARTGTRAQVRTAPTAANISASNVPTVGTPLYFFNMALNKAEYFGTMYRHSSAVTNTVYAVKPAATDDPDLVIVVTAHIDTVMASPGASDNGAGVAGVLENARRYKDVDAGNIEIIFAAVGSEESGGMRGAAWLAEEMIAQGKSGRVINLNGDMFGSPNPMTNGKPLDSISVHTLVSGGSVANPILNLPAWLMLNHAEIVPAAEGILNYKLNHFGSTDHIQFQNRGMDGVNVAIVNEEEHFVEEEYHTAEDNLEQNYSYERNLNATNMVSVGIAKAIELETSKRAKFEVKNLTSVTEVALANPDKQFLTYDRINAVFTRADGEVFDLSFTAKESMFKLPPGFYEVSNAVGYGNGKVNHKNPQFKDFASNMVSEVITLITSIRIHALSITTVARSQTYRFDLILNEGATDENVEWTIADPSLGYVDADGNVTIFDKTGNVRLTATDPVSGLRHSITLRIAS